MKTEEIAGKLRFYADSARRLVFPKPAIPTEAADALDAQAREIESTRRALEDIFPDDLGFTDYFDDFVRHGLLVSVPADEAFRAEWGEDEETMWVWRWHPLAGPSTPEETSTDG